MFAGEFEHELLQQESTGFGSAEDAYATCSSTEDINV
jgi:hypothetical protein